MSDASAHGEEGEEGEAPIRVLQFLPFAVAFDPSFHSTLTDRALDEWTLHSDQPRPLVASFTLPAFLSTRSHSAPLLLCRADALDGSSASSAPSAPSTVRVEGECRVFTTLSSFRAASSVPSLVALSSSLALSMWSALLSFVASSSSSKASEWTSRLLLLMFVDVKRHRCHYFAAYVALVSPLLSMTLHSSHKWTEAFDATQREALRAQLSVLREYPAVFLLVRSTDDETHWNVVPVDQLTHPSLPAVDSSSDVVYERVMIAVRDASNVLTNPGWPCRNALLFMAVNWNCHRIRLISWRDAIHDSATLDKSIIFDVVLSHPGREALIKGPIKGFGWERTVRGQIAPKVLDLASVSNPIQLATTSVNLNLRLMRWRALPMLDLTVMKRTRCLLLGAGTLGCNVSRLLMGWGFMDITFVDNGQVAHSNPVRQSLFNFEDATVHVYKAEQAARALHKIYPHVTSEGHLLTIAMPGHPLNERNRQEVEADVEKLITLVKDHDVIFLLTDTRESRWLPTLLARAHDKVVINAALGFDTYLVMRHGSVTNSLGCYFCNDVVAPTDSSRDRTLDQQCTVTRPGLAYIASACAVELLVNVLQHALRHHVHMVETDTGLGCIPHIIRGWMGQFSSLKLQGQAFSHCTACSNVVLEQYKQEGSAFILKVLGGGVDYLEDISGLKAMKESTERMMNELGESHWEDDITNEDEYPEPIG